MSQTKEDTRASIRSAGSGSSQCSGGSNPLGSYATSEDLAVKQVGEKEKKMTADAEIQVEHEQAVRRDAEVQYYDPDIEEEDSFADMSSDVAQWPSKEERAKAEQPGEGNVERQEENAEQPGEGNVERQEENAEQPGEGNVERQEENAANKKKAEKKKKGPWTKSQWADNFMYSVDIAAKSVALDEGVKSAKSSNLKEKIQEVLPKYTETDDGVTFGKKLLDADWADCLPLQYGLSKVTCDLFCIQDSVRASARAVLESLQDSHNILMQNLQALFDYQINYITWALYAAASARKDAEGQDEAATEANALFAGLRQIDFKHMQATAPRCPETSSSGIKQQDRICTIASRP